MNLRSSNAPSRISLEAMARSELRALQQERQAEALAATVKVVKPYIPHPPSPKQSQFLALDCEEALFGGAAGGGKSVALLYDALAHIDVPGYVAGLFRLTDEDWKTPDSLLKRAEAWFAGTDAQWDSDANGFRFPSGALVHFGSGYNGHLRSLVRAYQGIAFQFMGFDELGQWPLDSYRFLIGSRLRAGENKRHVPLRARATANPGGEEWVRERFIDGATHINTGDTYLDDWTAAGGDTSQLPTPAVYEAPPTPEAVEVAERFGRKAQGAFFVPSFLSDNPGFAGKRGEDYRVQMAQLDPVTRAQMEGGDWWVNAQGKLFQKDWFQYIDEEPDGLDWWRCWDLAGTAATKPGEDPAFTAGVRIALWQQLGSDRQRIVVSDLQHFREDPGGTELNVLACARAEGPEVRLLFEQEPGSAGKTVVHHYRSNKHLSGYTVEGFPKSGPKEEYWRVPSALAFNGDLVLVRGPWNRKLVDQLCGLPASKKKDIADALAMGAWKLLGYTRGQKQSSKVRRPTRPSKFRSYDSDEPMRMRGLRDDDL